MGNKSGKRILPEHVAVFDKLGIEAEEKKKIIDLFERALAYSNTFIGADEAYFQCKRKLSIRHFMSETRIEPPYFAAKCFELFDLTASDDVVGWLDLNEFTCALWNFLSLERRGVARVAFDLFDLDGKRALKPQQIGDLFRLVHGTTVLKPAVAQLQDRLHAQKTRRGQTSGDGVALEAFLGFVAVQPVAMYPAFEAQRQLRRKILGEPYWESMSEWRAEKVSRRGDFGAERMLRARMVRPRDPTLTLWQGLKRGGGGGDSRDTLSAAERQALESSEREEEKRRWDKIKDEEVSSGDEEEVKKKGGGGRGGGGGGGSPKRGGFRAGPAMGAGSKRAQREAQKLLPSWHGRKITRAEVDRISMEEAWRQQRHELSPERIEAQRKRAKRDKKTRERNERKSAAQLSVEIGTNTDMAMLLSLGVGEEDAKRAMAASEGFVERAMELLRIMQQCQDHM